MLTKMSLLSTNLHKHLSSSCGLPSFCLPQERREGRAAVPGLFQG